ncbi:hypothetical protein L798_07069 [Zootermopsis nevadensis]|uniref:Uncharacterized protein n=1 Tax=Zootermopsis nevadensis TaxID=136037 RepID=A0A067RFA1_ZOONE|nr:hypothetical protein L798_07069 [Zootermopsis nevadensis]
MLPDKDKIFSSLHLLLPKRMFRCVFGGGCLYWVCSSASLAAECWAFLMLAPSAEYSSSPSFNVTVNRFLCAGPCSLVRRYWCWIYIN